MKRLKKFTHFITPAIVIILIGLIWLQVIKPLAISFIQSQLPKINSAQNIVKLEVESIDLSLLKLQLIAYGVKADFKESLELNPLKAQAISCQLDIFDLIIGNLNLSKVIIEGADWSYTIKPSNSTSKSNKIPFDDIFKYSGLVPIDRLVIYNSNVKLDTLSPKMLVEVKVAQATLSHSKNELGLNTHQLSVGIAPEDKPAIIFENDININITKEKVTLQEISVKTLDSFATLKAELKVKDDIVDAPEGNINLNSKVNLQDVRTLILTLFPQKDRTPSISGFIESEGQLKFAGSLTNNLQGDLNIKTTQVVLDHFKLGQAQVQASLKKQQIEIEEIKLEHPSGNAVFKNLKIDQHAPYNFSTKMDLASFDLQKLFGSLGLGDIPAGMLASGNASCQGSLSPSPVVNCNVSTDVSNIWVKSHLKDTSHILKLKSAQLNGETKFTKDGMTYQTHIKMGTSQGTSKGQVDFKKGFYFEYQTDKLDFTQDVESLADLNLKGDLKISGTASGDSSFGIIKAKVNMSNAEVDSFRVGNLNADLNYKNTELHFDNLTATVGKSEVTGDLHFDFNKSKITAKINSKNLQAEDVLFILNKKFDLPITLTGAGTADVTLDGPFSFWKMSYNLKSSFLNGEVAGEKYNKLNVNLVANGNQIDFQDVSLHKLKSNIKVDGQIKTDKLEPEFALKMKANPLLLEEDDYVIRYAPSISGIGYADGKITGPLNSPEIFANFTLKQVSYDKVEYPNSQGSVTIDKKFFKFNGQFFGRQIQSDVLWPWNERDGFSAKILVSDLNPLFLLPLASIPQPSSDFNSKLNAEIDLSSKNKNILSADGSIKISDFLLQRGNQFLKLEKPTVMFFKSGLTQMEPLTLKGEDSYLSVKFNRNSADNIRLSINADLQLRLFHFLIPFTQSLGGNLTIDSQVVFKNNSFELFGEGELIDGLVSLKGFPQAIESINTPIEFSRSKIFLNDITGQLGQSDVTGVGSIDILGSKNIVVNLRAVADNVELNFPDKILTGGKANVLFTGNWLPYKLSVDYKVSHGLVEKDFEQDENQAVTLKASSYLPPQQIEQQSPSLTMDVNIDLSRGVIVKNKLVEGEAVGILQILGTPEFPLIKGQIDIKQGSKLIVKDKQFDIQTANITFPESKEINPIIYISANSRISDYDINMLVQGTPKKLSIKPTSQPPLSESDIFSLLALGVTSQNDQNLSSDTQQKQTGLEVLAAISNQSQLNKKIQEKLGLTLQLAPSVDSTKNIAVPKVVVSKKITNKINASYSKPFTGNDQNQEIKLQYLYNNNMSLQLNYQNKDTGLQDQYANPTNNSKSILGLDLELRDEFK